MGRETLYKRSITRELRFGFVTIAAIGPKFQMHFCNQWIHS